MLDLARAVARNPDAGQALPLPWKKLAAVATPRRAQPTLIYGPSGSCKSIVMMNLLLHWQIPTLYISPDTDQHDHAVRIIAHRQQMSTDSVEQGIEVGALDVAEELSGLRDWLMWSFDPSPTLDDIDLELAAFEELFGAPPEVIVVDTISDVNERDDEEFAAMRRNLKALKHVARVTGAATFVLSHVTGQYDDETVPAPRKALTGKVTKEATLILSVARNGPHFGAAVVKQRNGYQDVKAEHPVWLGIAPDRATVSDPVEYGGNASWSN